MLDPHSAHPDSGARIGVFLCHCGSNISYSVDVEAVSAWAAEELAPRGVVLARHLDLLCTGPGLERVVHDAREHGLTRVVIGACACHLKGRTFNEAIARGGLDSTACEFVRLREDVAWALSDRAEATAEAKRAIAAGVELARGPRSGLAPPAEPETAALVVGAGAAGLRAALDLARSDRSVYLVERRPAIGGTRGDFDPTGRAPDCETCLLGPRMEDAAAHPRIALLAFSEVERVSGCSGNFTVTVRRHARHVHTLRCNGCALCEKVCPTHVVDERAEAGLGYRKAIYLWADHTVPNYPVLDVENCTGFQGGTCRKCVDVCPTHAIDFEQTDDLLTLRVGSIVMANHCAIESASRARHDALLAVKDVLGSDLGPTVEWSFCAAIEDAGIGPTPAYAGVGCELASADRTAAARRSAVGPCVACYLAVPATDAAATATPTITAALAVGDPSGSDSARDRRLVLDALVENMGLEALRRHVVRPLRGLRVAPFVGCLSHRIEPRTALLEALGAEVVHFPLSDHCCGGHMPHLGMSTALELIRRVLASAQEAGANVLAVVCPLCRTNLDAHQAEVNRLFGTAVSLPVVYYMQLLGLALGKSAEELGFGYEVVSANPVLASIGVAPAQRRSIRPSPAPRAAYGLPIVPPDRGRPGEEA